MTRKVTFFAALIAVVVALAKALQWLADEVPVSVINTAWPFLIGVSLGEADFRMKRKIGGDGLTKEIRVVFGIAIAFAVALMIVVDLNYPLSDTLVMVATYGYAVALVAPNGMMLWLYDYLEHKRCPACQERVKIKARICRHCGHAFDADARVAVPTFTEADLRKELRDSKD